MSEKIKYLYKKKFSFNLNFVFVKTNRFKRDTYVISLK